MKTLEREVAEIKRLLSDHEGFLVAGATRTASPKPAVISSPVTLNFIPSHAIGSSDAKFVLIEFSDPQCPFCFDFERRALPVFKKDFVDTGKVRFYTVDFPLDSHPDARKLSLAAICAGKDGKYWEMRGSLSQSGKPTSSGDAIFSAAKEVGIAPERLEECMTSQTEQKQLADQIGMAQLAGVSSTPTFIVGRIEGAVIKGMVVVGDRPAPDFEDQVSLAMKSLLEMKEKEHARESSTNEK